MKFGARKTGLSSFGEFNRFAVENRGRFYGAFGSVFRSLSNVADGVSAIVKPRAFLRRETSKTFEHMGIREFMSLSEEYIAKVKGAEYEARGMLSVNFQKMFELAQKIDEMVEENRLNVADMFDYLEGRLGVQYPPDHPYEVFRRMAEEIGMIAVGENLLDIPNYRKFAGKYFPHITLEWLDESRNPYVLLFAMRNAKLIYDRFRERLANQIPVELLGKKPHYIFTLGLAQELFDITTSKFVYSLFEIDKAYGNPNIAKDAYIQLIDGREVPVGIALNVLDFLDKMIEGLRGQKTKIIESFKKSEEYKSLPRGQKRDALKEKIEQIDNDIKELEGERFYILKQIRRYKYIISLLDDYYRGSITRDTFIELSQNPLPQKIGLKEEGDYSYLMFDGEYYMANADRWVLVSDDKLRFGSLSKRITTMPQVSDYHYLNGMLVSRSLYNMLAEYFEFASPTFAHSLMREMTNLVIQLTNTHKLLNVALSPKSWFKNVIGNFSFYFLAGVPPHKIPYYFYKGISLLANPNSKKTLELYGVSSGSFGSELLRPIFDDIRLEMKKMQSEGIGMVKMLPDIFFNTLYKMTRELGVGRVYELIDEVARAGLIYYYNDSLRFNKRFMEVDENNNITITDEELFKIAMSEAYDYTIDYGDVSAFIKKIRSGIGGLTATPYITFMLHAPFVFAKSMRQNPQRAFAMLTLPVAAYVASWLSVMGDEEGEELYRVAVDSFKNFKTFVLPFKDEKGRFSFVSFAGWHPLDNWFDFISNLTRGNFGRALVEGGWVYSAPVSSLTLQLVFGIDPFTGQQVITELDKKMPDRYLLKILLILNDTFLPSFLKSYGDIPKLARGMEKTRALLSFLGINMHKRSVDDFLKIREAEYLKQLIDIGKERSELRRRFDRGDIGKSYFEDKMKELDELEKRVRQNRIKTYRELFGGEEDETLY